MKFLFDTNAVLLFFEGGRELSDGARAAMLDSASERWVSHVTPWEVAIKVSLGKLKLHVPYQELFPEAISANGWRLLAPSIRHYRRLLTLPLHHRDPFDRLLVTQALEDDMTIVSSDSRLADYGVSLLW